MKKYLAVFAVSLAMAGAANASSGEAWEQFAADVEEACRAATADYFTDPTVLVDPFGSESYGLAIVSGESTSVICVYDKEATTVEIGGELEAVVTPGAAAGN